MSIILKAIDREKDLLLEFDHLSVVLKNVALFDQIKTNIKDNSFTLYYQPIYNNQEKICCYECLIRMLDINKNLVYPKDFLPMVEHSELMNQIDYWVVQEAISILQKKENIELFINISSTSLESYELLIDIEKSIITSSIEPNRLGFEITEKLAIQNVDKVKEWMERFKKLGCKFALDDFGSGFSSFSYLSKLPIDYLKIDGSLIKEINSNPKTAEIVFAINDLAHSLGMKTIVECIENKETLELLKNYGVDFFQGFYLSPPLKLNHIKD